MKGVIPSASIAVALFSAATTGSFAPVPVWRIAAYCGDDGIVGGGRSFSPLTPHQTRTDGESVSAAAGASRRLFEVEEDGLGNYVHAGSVERSQQHWNSTRSGFNNDVKGTCNTDDDFEPLKQSPDPTAVAVAGNGLREESLFRRREVLSSFSKMTFVISSSFLSRSDATYAAEGVAASLPPSEEPSECRGGAIVSESAVPGAYQQLCMDLPERRILLKSTGSEIFVYQGTNSGEGGGGGSSVAGRTGVAVWNSSLLLVRLLDGLCGGGGTGSRRPSLLRDKAVVELGCGVGLASVAAAKLGASSVLATDANPEVLQLARRNIERNGVSDVARAVELHWGALDATEYEGFADIVVGSDLTYNSGSWRALAETMGTVIRPGGIVVYLTLGHSGFNSGGEIGGFLSVMQSEGLEVISEKNWDRWPQWGEAASTLTSLLRTSMSLKERAVIDANGGAQVILLGKKPIRRLS